MGERRLRVKLEDEVKTLLKEMAEEQSSRRKFEQQITAQKTSLTKLDREMTEEQDLRSRLEEQIAEQEKSIEELGRQIAAQHESMEYFGKEMVPETLRAELEEDIAALKTQLAEDAASRNLADSPSLQTHIGQNETQIAFFVVSKTDFGPVTVDTNIPFPIENVNIGGG